MRTCAERSFRNYDNKSGKRALEICFLNERVQKRGKCTKMGHRMKHSTRPVELDPRRVGRLFALEWEFKSLSERPR